MREGVLDLYFELLDCKHDWHYVDNPFGSLYKCSKCLEYDR